MTWKQLTERDCREWKLLAINPLHVDQKSDYDYDMRRHPAIGNRLVKRGG